MATPSPREQMDEVARTAKGVAQETLDRQTDSAASRLGSFAGALRKAAKESDAEGRGVGPMAEWAADGLERVSSTLRSRDLGGMLRDAEDFARRQPVSFFVAAAAAGFLATRFLKAGMGPEDAQSRGARTPPGGDSSATTDLSSMTRV